jgi:hypothetical protein
MERAMPSQDDVILWKAPQPGRDGAREIAKGFDPQMYPGNGPYFTTDDMLAERYQRHYLAGLQEIHMPRPVFEDLMSRGVIVEDPMYPPGIGYHVPPSSLPEFNLAIQQGNPNVFHPQ